MDIVVWIVGWLVSLVALYVVVRLAVTHALVSASRPRKSAPRTPEAPPAQAWWQGDTSPDNIREDPR